MRFPTLFTRWKSGSSRTRRRKPASARLTVEALEDRCLLSYTLIDLGTLGGAISGANGVNDAGQVVGIASLASNPDFVSNTDDRHAFLWDRTHGMRDLGALGGFDTGVSFANDINEASQVVGASGGHAFLWEQSSGLRDLGPGAANAINDAGLVVGDSYGVGVLWDSTDAMQPLAGVSSANDINNLGQIVGQSGQGTAVVWDPVSGLYDLGTLSGGDFSTATSLNEQGQVVGWSSKVRWQRTSLGTRPVTTSTGFLWQNGTMTSLGREFFPYAINDAGQIVGTASTGPVLWQNGVIVNLNSLIDPSSGWVLESPTDINNRGEIVGYGVVNEQRHAFLLTTGPSVPNLTINDVSVFEGNVGTANATFTVTLSEPLTAPVTVNYTTADGPVIWPDSAAVAGSDYLAVSGTVTFLPGEVAKPISVPIVGDRVVEKPPSLSWNENFSVILSNASGAVINDPVAIGTIRDDEPAIRIERLEGIEGNSGTTPFVFTVTLLTGAYDEPVTVDYATADASATVAGNDYVAASGTLTFAPGQTSKTFTVAVNGDTTVEPNEYFTVRLSNPSPSYTAIYDRSTVEGVIRNDDTTKGGGKKLSSTADGSGTAETLTEDQVTPLLAEALARWQGAGVDTTRLATIEVRITDLPGLTLGRADGHTIWLDANAAGSGWFLDPTPADDAEFLLPGDQGEQGRLDLLTVLMHEMGHVLGYEHEEDGVMQELLPAGTRWDLVGDWLGDMDWLGVAWAVTSKSANNR